MSTKTANYRTVPITVASGGIGRELALEFASRTQAVVRFARRTGTGVAVTRVCPGPARSGFDEVAGSAGGMIGAARCAGNNCGIRASGRPWSSRPALSLADENAAPAAAVVARKQAANGASRTRARRS